MLLAFLITSFPPKEALLLPYKNPKPLLGLYKKMPLSQGLQPSALAYLKFAQK